MRLSGSCCLIKVITEIMPLNTKIPETPKRDFRGNLFHTVSLRAPSPMSPKSEKLRNTLVRISSLNNRSGK